MDWKFYSGLTILSLTAIGLTVFFGKKLSKRSECEMPDGLITMNITLTGVVAFAFLVGFWVLCITTRTFSPESVLGKLTSTPDGIVGAISLSVIGFGIAGALLGKIGYPIFKIRDLE